MNSSCVKFIINSPGGETAWSATEIEIDKALGGKPLEFKVDHPFLFYIEDETTGTKIFTGRVDDPGAHDCGIPEINEEHESTNRTDFGKEIIHGSLPW